MAPALPPRATLAEDFSRLVRLKRLREPGRPGARPAVLHYGVDPKFLFDFTPYGIPEIGEPRRALYESLVPEIRRVAWDMGFAVAVHGSMRRDLDLIAYPWIDTAAASATFVRVLAQELGLPPEYPFIFPHDFKVRPRPHGREPWVIHLSSEFGDGPYLDIAIPPRV